MNYLKPKIELLRRIMAAYQQAKNAGVKDPGRVILETMEAQRKVKLFLSKFMFDNQ